MPNTSEDVDRLLERTRTAAEQATIQLELGVMTDSLEPKPASHQHLPLENQPQFSSE